jgi:hypothetical protein
MRIGTWSKPAGLLATALIVAAAPAKSFELTSGAHLAERCRGYLADRDGADGRFCDGYLRGFIDGSAAIAIQDAQMTESFTQRAARTRLGRPVSAKPQYCIGTATTMQDLVEQLLAEARTSPPRDEVDASVLLYAMLNRYHACPR